MERSVVFLNKVSETFAPETFCRWITKELEFGKNFACLVFDKCSVAH